MLDVLTTIFILFNNILREWESNNISKNKRALFTSNNQVYETPDYLFKELSDVFRFKLDVCASNENAKCQMYFTEKKSGFISKMVVG